MKKDYSRTLFAALAFASLGMQQAWADKVVTSTADAPRWFQIVAKRETRVVTDNGTGQNLTGAVKGTAFLENNKWRFEQKTDGTYVIVSQKGDYIDPATIVAMGDRYNNSAFQPISTKPTTGWKITETATGSDYYTIAAGNKQLHQGNDGTNYCIINYGGGSNTSDEGCLFTFKEYSSTSIRTEAKALYTNTPEGTNPGQVSAETRQALKTVIDNSAATADQLEKAIDSFKAAIVKVQVGKKYYIVSGPSTNYCQGKYMYSPGEGQQSKFGEKVSAPTYAWTFTDAGDGKFYMQNCGTHQFVKLNNDKNSTMTATGETKMTITSLGQGAFNITPDGKNPLHAQNDGSVIVVWAGGLNTASAWKFEEVSAKEQTAPTTFNNVTAFAGTQTYAPNQQGQVLIGFMANVVPGWTNETFTANSVTLDLGATQATDVENIKVYTSANANFISNGQRNATLVGEVANVTGNEVKVNFTQPVSFTTSTRFYVTADIKASATVGHKLDVAVKGFTYNTDQQATLANANPEGTAVIYKVQSAPYQPYDLGSHYWRIPAMVILKHQKDAAKNGRVITMADNRFNHNTDLPSHIDVYERHSDNNGATWSDHKMVVGTAADEALVADANGNHKGFGDVTMVETSKGRIIALMVGGAGYFYSTEVKGNRIVPVIITSDDGGDTWSAPRTLDEVLYNTKYNEGQVKGSFAGSGRGLLLQHQKDEKLNGRVMFAMSHRFTVNNANSIQEYIIYSDDEGETWKFSTESAYNGGDESKLVETADGTVIISVRQSGQRGYNTSTDGGVTWGTQAKWADINGNACNGDILYVNKHVMLHSYPNNGSRKNVTIKASFDQGKTWSKAFEVCAPSSCYSTMDVTKDGDIAIFYEDAACSTGFVLNYAVLPTNFIYEGNLSQKALDAAVASAQKVTKLGGYTNIEDAKANQFEQSKVEAIEALVSKATSTKLTDDEKDDLATEIEAAVNEALPTVCTVDGQPNTTTYTISSYEKINNASPKMIDANAKAVDNTDYEWRITPSTTTVGEVYIQGKNEEKYLYRSGATLAVTNTPKAWTVTKGEGEYWYLRGVHNQGSYLVINTSTGTFNYWSNTTGSSTWSTKFVLNAKGMVTGIDAVDTNKPTLQTELHYYDLQGRRVMNPTKGIFITNTGKKVVK